jgi:rhamnulokinase
LSRVFAAVDLGASGGRVMAGAIEGDRLSLAAVHRFPNGIVKLDGHLRWDLTHIYQEVCAGLHLVPDAESLGIDTWGVDYGLLDADGRLLAEPISYRDDHTSDVIEKVHALVRPDDLYRITGVQLLPFNTVYQLAAEQRGALWPRVHRVVLIPDLLAYWLTGELRSELTIASTTGLMDVRTRDWSTALLDRLAIPLELLPPIEPPGELRGRTAAGTAVITVGSHDTASAVVAVPATTDRFAYISSGTWSVVGLELDRPVVSDDARRANFSNEAGVDGRTRFLRNVGGLWLLQECLRAWPRHNLDELLQAAADLPARGGRIDVNDTAFIPPGRMPERIAAACGRPMSEAETVRCTLDSLASAYAETIQQAMKLSGHQVDVLHVIGGGSQNSLLCQLTANATALPVVAGPTEATTLGNVLVQARTASGARTSLESLRTLVAASSHLRRYQPC